jgi:hypothetical protein
MHVPISATDILDRDANTFNRTLSKSLVRGVLRAIGYHRKGSSRQSDRRCPMQRGFGRSCTSTRRLPDVERTELLSSEVW